MGVIIQVVLGVVAYGAISLVLLPILNGATKNSAAARLASYLVLGLGAAFVLTRVGNVELPVFLLLALAMWVSCARGDKLMDDPAFRERTGTTISRTGMLVSRVALVGAFIVASLALTLEVCSVPLGCRPLLF